MKYTILDTDQWTNPLRKPSQELSRVLQSLRYPGGAAPSCVNLYQSKNSSLQYLDVNYLFADGTETREVTSKGRTFNRKAFERFIVGVTDRGISIKPVDGLAFGGPKTPVDYQTMFRVLGKWMYLVITGYDALNYPLNSVKIELGIGHFSHFEKVLSGLTPAGEHALFLYDTARYASDDYQKLRYLGYDVSDIDEDAESASANSDDSEGYPTSVDDLISTL